MAGPDYATEPFVKSGEYLERNLPVQPIRTGLVRRWVVRGFTYFGLVYYSQGLIAAMQAASGDVARTVAGETNLSSTLAQSVILAGLLVAFACRPRRYVRLGSSVVPVFAIAAFALLSVLWSADPVRTLRRAVALTECFGFGVFLYRTGGLERTVERIGIVCVAMAVLSLLVFVAAPGIGRETALGYERALRGVFPHKNSMAECMLLGLCCFAYPGLGWSWRRAGAVLLLAMCLVLGRGASALAVGAGVGLVAVWMRLAGQPALRLSLGFLLAWGAVAAAVALLLSPQEVFALLGREPSLTGRVPLWQAIWPAVTRAPWLGHGYAGFWMADSATVQMIWRYAGWQAPDAHSSYLDILLQLGLVGLGLYAWAWVALLRRTVAATRAGFGPASFVWLYAGAWLVAGLDEGIIPIPNTWTALLPVALLALAGERRRRAQTV